MLFRSVSFDKEQKEIRAKLKNDYEKMTVALERTAFRLANFHTAKRTLRDTLSKPNPSVNEIYLLLEKTIKYPDVECLQLYSKALELFESNFDIVRLIRNGIMQFARNPEKL